MLGKPIIGVAILLVCFIVLASNGVAQMQERETKLSSLQLRASIVAYDDFAKKISVQTGGPSDLAAHISNIDNYSVTISEEVAHYVVIFLPNRLAGQKLLGGGARYMISKASFKIQDLVRFK